MKSIIVIIFLIALAIGNPVVENPYDSSKKLGFSKNLVE